jgi:hypothetical protein
VAGDGPGQNVAMPCRAPRFVVGLKRGDFTHR